MSRRTLVTFAALVFWLTPAVAPAVPLFPLQLGAYTQYDGSDLSGHTWEASIWVVAQNINLNSQTYFHIRRQNWNPYGWSSSGPQDSLIRSTDADAFMSLGGPEWHQFSTTAPGSWQYWEPPGQTETYVQVDVTGPMGITVPYGYFPQAYENRAIFNEPGHQSNPWYAYLAPGLGFIKEVQTDVPPGNTANTQVLSAVGAKSVSLFPLKTGMLLTYNASDSKANTWKMTKHVMEQVTIGGETFFRVRTSNFDPFLPGEAGDSYSYLRSTAQQVFESWDGVEAHVSYQANSPGTAWSYPGEGGFGTCENTIISVTPFQVMGGSYLAYVNQASTVGPAPAWFYYAVPGLGMVYQDTWRPGDWETRLYFTLTSVTQGSVNPGILLLLE